MARTISRRVVKFIVKVKLMEKRWKSHAGSVMVTKVKVWKTELGNMANVLTSKESRRKMPFCW